MQEGGERETPRCERNGQGIKHATNLGGWQNEGEIVGAASRKLLVGENRRSSGLEREGKSYFGGGDKDCVVRWVSHGPEDRGAHANFYCARGGPWEMYGPETV